MGAPIIIASGLQKSYRGICVVDNVSLEISSGEVLGVLGPNGAGKSTTVKMLYGAVRPQAGSISIAGYDLKTHPRQARQTIGVVSQEGDSERDFSILEDLVVYGSFFGVSRSAATIVASGLIDRLGLTEHQWKLPDELSGGQRRRASLARALIGSPAIVFLDEPTTGLDPDARQEFWRLVAQLRDEGKAVLLTTHYMDEAERLCDRLLLMQRGRIVRHGTPTGLIADIVGERVIEVEGVEHGIIADITERTGTRYRPYGMGHTIIASRTVEREVLELLSDVSADRISQRAANLDDVFLALTGEQLGL